jgi:endonuclease/exonuclease/phosphatase (EEP) superfamily protein YafD
MRRAGGGNGGIGSGGPANRRSEAEIVIFLVYAVGLACIGATIVPLSKHEAWWIRSCDFPRLQIVVGTLVAAALLVVTADMARLANQLLVLALAGCIAFQLVVILPYTRLWPVELVSAPTPPSPRSLRLLVVNVLMTNRRTERLFALIREHDPDVVLAVETDAWWSERFGELAPGYAWRLEHPLENTYGMLLYSKLELVEPEIRFLLKPDIPSIRTSVRLRSGEQVRLFGLHPEPPGPSEADSSLPRDAELILIAREVEAASAPTIVIGDLNDVAWSHTSRLFRRISGLLDPRIGRGMFNSFHAGFWPLRWPLDHVFVSEAFALHAIRRLPAFGSDHFPIYIEIEHRPAIADHHKPPEADRDDRAEAADKLARVDAAPTPVGGE